MRILISALYPYIFLLLFILLPFDDYVRALPNILILALIAFFPFVVEKSQLKKLKTPPVILLGIFILYLFLNSFFSGRIAGDIDVISKVLVALALAILYIPINDLQKIKNALILSALAAIAFSVYNFVIIAHETGSFALGDSPQVVDSLLIDRIYLGLLCVFSILISFQGLRKTYHPLNSYYLGNIFINILFLILIASKVAIIALLGIFVLNQFYGKQKIWKYGLAAVAFIGIFGILFLLKNKDNQKVQDSLPSFITSFVSKSMTYEIRSLTWSCVDKISENNSAGLFGMGFEQTEKELLNCYEETIIDENKRKAFVDGRYNIHSQYFDFFLSQGILSVLLFAIFIIGSFITIRRDPYALSMLLLLVFYCFVENVFHRQMGAYYVGVIIITLMLSRAHQTNQINNENGNR